MKHVLFVCHGNICRSPMAEYIFKHLVRLAHLEQAYVVDSVAVSNEESGNDVYPPAKRVLAANGIPCPRRRARRITRDDLQSADYVLCMDNSNLRWLARLLGYSPKVQLLGDYGLDGAEIEDPWYSGNFDKVFEQIRDCCQNLLQATKDRA